MSGQPDQVARDQWQAQPNDAPYRFAATLKKLHETNPWPEHPVLGQAIEMLMTELWDPCFSQTEIRTAFEDAVADLPRYAGSDEIRP